MTEILDGLRLFQRKRRVYWAAGALVMGLMIVLLLLTFNRAPDNVEITPLILGCINNKLGVMKIDKPDITTLTQVSSLCYSEILGENLLKDFEIRKNAFVQQYRAENILLWMVVAITIAGVVLAAVQLIASYKLAQEGHSEASGSLSNELILQKDKISLKSSITGLLILTVSFAFFMVFVQSVYTVEIKKTSPNENPITSAPSGGLGRQPEANNPSH
jgi:hypothetical protein